MFPNSIPSQFLTEKSIGESNQKYLQAQKEGLKTLEEKLVQILGDDFTLIQRLTHQLTQDPNDSKTRVKLKMLDEELTKRLLSKWPQH